ncbi:hypothetical protein [Roseomonas sp. USHLN139]|uniref:hypothetical protein n=1 Tax=Roseomonas sp. USHLN139 TaxID=3081298 RepID=UPI003B024FF8
MPASEAATPLRNDANLIALCTGFAKVREHRLKCDAACRAADENDPAAERAWEEACDAETAALEGILAISPRSRHGLAAKARVAKAFLAQEGDEEPALADRFARQMVEDVLAVVGEAG